MPRSKKTASKRQRQSDDVVYIEPPPEHQFAKFFSRFDDLNHYVFNFHERKEISPRIFKHLGIDFSNESGRILAQQHVIDIRVLHHMGRNIQREEEEQAPPPQAQEPQEDQVGPSEQPSMRDMMEILQRMEINQQNLSQQIQSLKQEQGRMR
ncbi:hypothetical protein PIB30_068055 [Stylosanthes scabra]|uniref:Uncharacterized protein n=1 Tax=Stylosanthes scabra TaxID=79078 RepID=A0ABU6RMP8_9FABA|nr:hypothetical protein [Stylosanthes scabra]